MAVTCHCRIFYRCVDWNSKDKLYLHRWVVASFTDAWIETTHAWWRKRSSWSHLLQMRGLKHIACGSRWNGKLVASFTDAWIETTRLTLSILYCSVASFTDAWIETFWMIFRVISARSHLLQMRGLKQYLFQNFVCHHSRIFYRCVDWNTGGIKKAPGERVASFTDAWIETFMNV